MMKVTLIAVLMTCSVTLAQTTRPTTQPTTDASSPQSVSADQMQADLLKPPANSGRSPQPLPEKPTQDKTSGSGAVKPNAPPVTVLREGTFIIDRLCRLTKTADGNQYEVTFESDGKAMRDPPMIVLPNLKLMLMEGAAAGRDVKFRVTGMVTEYRGRNYILLEKVVVPTESIQQF